VGGKKEKGARKPDDPGQGLGGNTFVLYVKGTVKSRGVQQKND